MDSTARSNIPRLVAKRHGLSKSKILDFLQCPKRLWLAKNHPELADNSGSQRAFKSGHEVGDLARRLYGAGTLISLDNSDLEAALTLTAERIKSREGFPLYEATFEHDGVLVKADIVRGDGHSVELLEVKNSTSVKDQYLSDCAVQAWVMSEAGSTPSRISVVHLNNRFVYKGDSNYEGIFTEVDVTKDVRPLLKQVPRWVKRARETLDGGEPERNIGPHCSVPYDCPFYSHCEGPKTKYPVTILPHGGKRIWQLRQEGFRDIRQIPEGELTSELHLRVQKASQSGDAFIAPELAETLRAIPYSRYYLDFETLGLNIPHWPGTRPYEAAPFQWSCHRVAKDGATQHMEFLADGAEPPMREFAQTLLKALGSKGPVLVYSSFESKTLTALAHRFKDLAPALDAVKERLVDLLPILRKYYYHPKMMGSWSIKAVLPAVCPQLSHAALGIVQDGDGAQDAYAETLQLDCTPIRRAELRDALLAYCRLDTRAMVEIVRTLSA